VKVVPMLGGFLNFPIYILQPTKQMTVCNDINKTYKIPSKLSITDMT